MKDISMTFKEALEVKNKNVYAEYQMRAARIVNWLLEQGDIKEDEAEKLYQMLWIDVAESQDEFDEIVFDILDKMKSKKAGEVK